MVIIMPQLAVEVGWGRKQKYRFISLGNLKKIGPAWIDEGFGVRDSFIPPWPEQHFVSLFCPFALGMEAWRGRIRLGHFGFFIFVAFSLFSLFDIYCQSEWMGELAMLDSREGELFPSHFVFVLFRYTRR